MEAASDPSFFQQTHVIFGGTGAVGGSTALRLLDFFDEAIGYYKPESPKMQIIVTGLKKKEIRDFTTRLYHIHEREHGCKPQQIKGIGYRMASGVMLRMENFSVELPMKELNDAAKVGNKAAAQTFMDNQGLGPETTVEARKEALTQAIGDIEEGPFTAFLKGLRESCSDSLRDNKFTSVIVGIPLPSVATYHSNRLEGFARELGIERSEALRDLKIAYLKEFPEDLGYVAENLASDVLVAHTTGVGGMYDEDLEGNSTIRLGFAHSALGRKLLDKQEFASEMTREYSNRNIKMLVTAAAIGIDEILQRQAPPLKGDLHGRLQALSDAGHDLVPREDLKRKCIHVYRPEFIDLYSPTHMEIRLEKGHPMVCDFFIRSGENGFFSVSNADALYRVMRVASDSELGFVLARTAVFGDHPKRPKFVDNVYYYTETDYSRQVFDLLGQPALKANQLSGLQPKALQDLGSSKHQCELHVLALLNLLYRLQTLNLFGIKSQIDLEHFDAAAYFEAHSQPLMLDEIIHWDAQSLAEDLRTLVTAETEADLASFHNVSPRFPDRKQAYHAILGLVQRAVWAVPSLGTPILFNDQDRERVAVGYYAAPIDEILSHKYTMIKSLREAFKNKQDNPDEAEFQRFVEFHIANNGIADLRPQATLITCKDPYQNLEGKVQVFDNEADFVEALDKLEPYSYFTSSGLIALLVRLKGLARWSAELDISIGTANDFRSHFLHDESGHAPLTPGLVEAFRMFSEGLEKNTGSERLDGLWGYGWPPPKRG